MRPNPGSLSFVSNTKESNCANKDRAEFGPTAALFGTIHQHHSIEIEPDAKPPHGRIYNLSEAELKALKACIETTLANSFIQRSSSPAASAIVFAKKKKEVKNRCPLPLISKTRDRMRNARIFTKLELRRAYNQIRIKEGDEWKTAFSIRIRQSKSHYAVRTHERSGSLTIALDHTR